MLAVFGKLFVFALALIFASDARLVAQATGWDVLNTYEPVFNTLILVILALLGRSRIQAVKQAVDDTHTSVGHTAEAASAAATAAAETARISKDIGAIFRDMQSLNNLTPTPTPIPAPTVIVADTQQSRIQEIETELERLRNQ